MKRVSLLRLLMVNVWLIASGLASLYGQEALSKPLLEEKAKEDEEDKFLKLQPNAYWKYRIKRSIPAKVKLPEAFGEFKEEKGTRHYEYLEQRRYIGPAKIRGFKKPLDLLAISLAGTETLLEIQYLDFAKEGIYSYGSSLPNEEGNSENLLFNNPILIIAKDTVAGTDWDWGIKPSPKLPGGIKFDFKVIGDEQVETVAGKFTATRIQVIEKVNGAQTAKRDYWYAHDVGLVKEVDERYPGKGQLFRKESELLEFDLAPVAVAPEDEQVEKEEEAGIEESKE